MPQSLVHLGLHAVFSTKQRQPFLSDADFAARAASYLSGILNSLHCPPVAVGVQKEHVHLLCLTSRNMSVSEVVKECKRVSSFWIKKQTTELQGFAWQNGYGAFGVSSSNIKQVAKYIMTQDQHHARKSFEDEFRILLKKHGLEYDERYLWD